MGIKLSIKIEPETFGLNKFRVISAKLNEDCLARSNLRLVHTSAFSHYGRPCGSRFQRLIASSGKSQ